MVPAATPISKEERLVSLDAVRGFALLGILLMNIAAWGLHHAAYDNPLADGGPAEGPNLWFWLINHLLFEGKMRALFSMVFGAGLVVLTSRLDARGVSSADVYYRRILWLLLFGMLHAYLLWVGDILYPYALCGLALYPFRKMRPRSLLIISGVLVALTAGANVGQVFFFREMKQKGEAALKLEKEGTPLTFEQKKEKASWEGWRSEFQPGAEDLKRDREAWGGSFDKVFKRRAEVVMGFFHSSPYYGFWNWDVWSMMFLGMALYKMGVFSGERPAAFYLKMALVLYAVGLTANSFSAWNYMRTQWNQIDRGFYATTYDLGRLTVGLAHASLIILLCQNGLLRWLTGPLAAVGQMAFSNYVMQSVICSTIFYGYGFGLYGKLERYQLLYVVFGVWLFQLAFSPVWLRYFRFGPLEWGWRSLTYWKQQPFRIRAMEPEVAAEPEAEPQAG